MTAGTALIIAALIVVGNCTDLTLTGEGSGDTISTFRPALDGPLEKHNCGTRSVSTVAHVMAISESPEGTPRVWCEKCPEGYWGAVSRPGGVIIQDGVMLLEDCVSCSDDYICSPSAEECTSCIDVPAPTVTASSDVRVSKATVGNLAHGGLMIFAWACLSPIGISFMKYGKHLPASTWFKAHKFLMPMAILFTIAGLATILAPGVKHSALAVNSKGKKNHAQYGFAVVALCVVQGLLGYFRNTISMYQADDYDPDYPHGQKRYIFTGLHRTTGWVLCVLSLVNISKGLALFEEETPRLTASMRWSSSAAAMVPRASPYQGDWDPVPAGSLFKAYCFVALGFVVILELVHVTKYQWSSGGPFSCSSKKTAYATFVAQGDMEMKFRNIALALFSAFSVSMTVALCVLLHYRMF